ncbi:retinol-binding protein 2-like isoform X1 [Scomber scombrus]|uniref:Cellular retinoic acid-binding protein 1 n=1 Tax=Scomber scombrus TaxID=13677 RepID=A0AAV1N094_SCOSC
MPVDFNGKWILETNNKFEEYLKALNIDFATRKIAISLSQTKVIVQDGEKFNFKTLSTFRNYELSFTVGEEFDEHTKGLDSRNIKCLVIWEGDKLVCTQKGEKANRTWKHWIEGDKLYLKWNEVDGVNYVFFMNLSSLPVTTGGRYELRGKLIYRDVQGGAIIMSSKFEADWMKYVGVRATRGAIPPFCVDHVRPPKNIEFRMRPDVRAKV